MTDKDYVNAFKNIKDEGAVYSQYDTPTPTTY